MVTDVTNGKCRSKIVIPARASSARTRNPEQCMVLDSGSAPEEGESRNDIDVNFLQQSFRFAEIAVGLPLGVGCGMIASTTKTPRKKRRCSLWEVAMKRIALGLL